jgi:hypothetical protein
MGFLDRLRGRPVAPAPAAPAASAERSPLSGRACTCPEHVEDLVDLRIPVSAEMREEDFEEWSVAELMETGALEARRTTPEEQWLTTEDGRVGPLNWSLWVGDEARSVYDDDAPLSVAEALAARPGIEVVEGEDREVFWLRAPTLCHSGVLAAAARALADPRVREGSS